MNPSDLIDNKFNGSRNGGVEESGSKVSRGAGDMVSRGIQFFKESSGGLGNKGGTRENSPGKRDFGVDDQVSNSHANGGHLFNVDSSNKYGSSVLGTGVKCKLNVNE
jgi:hypothetical protein